nr:hypothetical protein [Gemmatimonadaceae bacterium]
GFEPVIFSATVELGDSLSASVTLTPIGGVAGQRLDSVKVMADFGRSSRRLQGFEERKRTANGIFITKEEIDLRRPSAMTDLLRGRQSLTVQRNNATGGTDVYGPRLSIGSGFCPLALIVDGTLIQNASGALDTYVPVDMILGIEVYATGTRVPGEFQRLGTDCGAIIVWTR